MEHELLFGTFHLDKILSGPEEQDYHFRCSVAPGNFPLERHEKRYSISAFSQTCSKL